MLYHHAYPPSNARIEMRRSDISDDTYDAAAFIA